MELNINREVEDAFYRYKMPKLSAKVEGKGNGIKTVIVNVSDIAKALNRKPIYLTKYFGCELGAQTRVDENERYIVNGAHEAVKLQELLDGFIKKFVLCQSCGNPETTMRVNKKSGSLGTVCIACGSQGQLDVTHRLSQFIIKNPPESSVSASKTRNKKSKKCKNGDKNSDEDHEISIAGDDASRNSPPENRAEPDDDDWYEDTTEEAQLRRMNELSAMAKSLALSLDVEKTDSERANVLYKHLLQLVKENNVLQCRQQIKQEADRLELGGRATLVVVEALLSDPSTMLSDIKKYASVFVLFTRMGEDTRRAQYCVLCAMTRLIQLHDMLQKSCHFLKALYDNDVVEEEAIIAWYEKGPSEKFVSKEIGKKIFNQCQQMVKWLQEAEEESDDDDVSNHSHQAEFVQPTVVPCKEPVLDPNNNSESDDDIDIDAI